MAKHSLIKHQLPQYELLLSLSDKELHHLVTIFYDYMLSHTESALFLNTEQVNSRLSSSMFHWLRAVLGSSQQDLHELLAKQHEIGIVHAHRFTYRSGRSGCTKKSKKNFIKSSRCEKWLPQYHYRRHLF